MVAIVGGLRLLTNPTGIGGDSGPFSFCPLPPGFGKLPRFNSINTKSFGC